MKVSSAKQNSIEQTRQAEQTRFRQAARMYEKQFLREMVKAMRKTVGESGFIKKNMAEKIFQEQLDQQYVESWGDQGGIGLADLIYEQMMNRYGTPQGGMRPVPPRGILPLEKSRVFPVKPPSENQIDLELKPNSPQSQNLRAPWPGTIQKSWSDQQQTVVEIAHDHGVQSRFVTRDTRPLYKVGDEVEQGAVLMNIPPGETPVHWRVQRS